MIHDNPAERLLKILQDGKNENVNAPCRAVWARLLNVEITDHALMMSRMGKVMELPNQIISELKEKFPNQSNTYEHWSKQLSHAFLLQNINDKWDTFIKHIDNHSIAYLQLSANLLQSKSIISLIEKEKLNEIREKIDNLYKEIIETDLDEKVKEFLLRAMQKILVSVDEYNISGSIPIMDSIDMVFGHMVVNDEFRNEMNKTPITKTLFERLSDVANIVTVSQGLTELSSYVKQLLLGES
ncbi:hypothetical protein Sulku_1294 [Sulfuricurvum kujiense DSM 16994]|uniref:Uncharacterized protein n=2 Tax=Sulfuricurvum kujiense TaxID=148813 RepID=E4TY37_SULKY|nr:hypothetical protein Sulku_1294 [Sulfuricurvum kujiense DSM 16994]